MGLGRRGVGGTASCVRGGNECRSDWAVGGVLSAGSGSERVVGGAWSVGVNRGVVQNGSTYVAPAPRWSTALGSPPMGSARRGC